MTTDSPIPREDIRALFDIATHSLDFGSGFLDKEEIELLRRTAVALGVDPMEGTPSCEAMLYPHTFKPNDRNVFTCAWDCSRPPDAEVHSDDGERILSAAIAALGDDKLAEQIRWRERSIEARRRRPFLYGGEGEPDFDDPDLDRLRAEHAHRSGSTR